MYCFFTLYCIQFVDFKQIERTWYTTHKIKWFFFCRGVYLNIINVIP